MGDWRRYALPLVLWVYGIAVTVTLVSVWGRAVIIDGDLVSSAAAEAATARPVADRIEAWLTGELAGETGVDGATASDLAEAVVHDPTMEETLGELVEGVVAAAALPPGDEAVVDVAGILSPAAPVVAAHAQSSGVVVDQAAVEAFVASLDPLVVRRPGETPVVGPASDAARTLSWGTVVGLVVTFVSGGAAVVMSDDRRMMLRSLLNRVALSALGFAIMFRLGAWLLDPGAGRAPARLAASRLAGAKLWLPAVIAVVAGAGGRALRTRVRWRAVTPGEASPLPASPPT